MRKKKEKAQAGEKKKLLVEYPKRRKGTCWVSFFYKFFLRL